MACSLADILPHNAELCIRQAEERDRKAIVEDLSAGVYDGNDYLPARIDFYYRDEDAGRKVMLLCCDRRSGAPLGLDVVCLFDAGETVMLQALRVRGAARGRGVATALSEAADRVVREVIEPRPRCVRIITTRTNPSVGLHTKQGFSPVHGFGICGTSLAYGDVQACPAEAQQGACVLRELEDPREVLGRLPASEEGGGPPPYVVFDWQVERWTAHSLGRLQRCHGVRFMSHRDPDSGLHTLSLGAPTCWVSGTQLYGSVYCGGRADALRAHVAYWARAAVRGRATHLVLFYDAGLHPGRVVHGLLEDELGGARGEWMQFFESSGGVVIMEKAIEW